MEKQAGFGLLSVSVSAPWLLVAAQGCGPGDAAVLPMGTGCNAWGPGGPRALTEPCWASLLLKLLALGWSNGQPSMLLNAGSNPSLPALLQGLAALRRSPCMDVRVPEGRAHCRSQGILCRGVDVQGAGYCGCRDLDLLPESNSDVAADLGECLKEWVAEGVDAQGVDSADALDLYQVALDAGHHCPDVAEGDEGKKEAPDDSQGDAQDGREQPVAPVLADGEGGVAGFPDAVKAVCSHRLSYHILKIHLGGENTEVKEVWGTNKGSSARVRIHCNIRAEPEWRGLGRARAVLGRMDALNQA